MTAPEAEALFRSVCVHFVADTERRNNQRPNVSRISIKTGVDRHTVASLLKSPPEDNSHRRSIRDPLHRVIGGWLSDPDYTERDRPKILDITSSNPVTRTVWTLIQKYAPGVWPRLLIDELIRVNYVATLPSGQLKWRGLPNPRPPSRRLNRTTKSELMRFALQALFHDTTRPDSRHLWRSAQTTEIDRKNLPLVRKILRDRLDATFAWIMDELGSTRWISSENAPNHAKVRIGITGFTFEEVLFEEVRSEPKKTKQFHAKE